MKRWIKRVLVWIFVVFCYLGVLLEIGQELGLISPAYGQTPETAVATGLINYQNIAPLQQAMPFSMRLPTVVVYANNLASTGQFFATGGTTTDPNEQWTTGYDISILDSPNCGGGLICTIAYASAEIVMRDRPSIDAEYAWMTQPRGLDAYLEHADHSPGWVQLSNGMSVYLVPWVNGGAGMGYEQAVWDETISVGVVRYTVGLKGGDPQWLIGMADSIFN